MSSGSSSNSQKGCLILMAGLVIIVLIVVVAMFQMTRQMIAPVDDLTRNLGTQVSQIVNPTPTIIPDPVTVIHEVRTLARLETIQYSVEKVITAETGQGAFGFLFGDKLLFVAHGVVIAGMDLSKLGAADMWNDGGVLYVRLPDPELFVITLDNEKSYVYDRETGLLTYGDVNLETLARQAAEKAIGEAALSDGILEIARQNVESYLSRLLRDLGYPEVIFVYGQLTPEAAVTETPTLAPAP
jgi:hypothetical protein